MRLIILGAGTSIPAKGYSPAGLVVRVHDEPLLFDAGPGTIQRLSTIAGVDCFRLRHVFLTHFHLDHCADLATLLFALRIPRPGRRQPLTVVGPRGLTRLYRRLNAAYHGWLAPRGYRVAFRETGAGVLRFPGYTVRVARMNHSTTALGYRVEQAGRSVAYSGDTDVCDAIVELGRGADALVLECSMPDERKVAGHLTPTECGRIAAHAGCRHLVLTHFYPVFQGYEIRRRVRRSFRGRLTLARDGLSLTL